LDIDGYILAWLNNAAHPVVFYLQLIISIYDFQCGADLIRYFTDYTRM
jgi:hypothetical protein